MNTSVTINRPQIDSIFATPHISAPKRDASLSVKTRTDAGVSQPAARLIVASLKNCKKGNVAFSGTAAEAIEYLEAL